MGSTNIFDVINRAQGLEFFVLYWVKWAMTEVNGPTLWSKGVIHASSKTNNPQALLSYSVMLVLLCLSSDVYLSFRESRALGFIHYFVWKTCYVAFKCCWWPCKTFACQLSGADSSNFYIFTHGTYFPLCFTKWVNLHLHGVFTLSSQDWSKIHSFLLIRPIPVFNWSLHLITRSLIIKNYHHYHHCIVCCE